MLDLFVCHRRLNRLDCVVQDLDSELPLLLACQGIVGVQFDSNFAEVANDFADDISTALSLAIVYGFE